MLAGAGVAIFKTAHFFETRVATEGFFCDSNGADLTQVLLRSGFHTLFPWVPGIGGSLAFANVGMFGTRASSRMEVSKIF